MQLDRFAPVVTRGLVVAAFAAVPVLGLFWPNLAAAMCAPHPDTVASVLVDGLVCFGPLGVPLLGMGGVVVWMEQKR